MEDTAKCIYCGKSKGNEGWPKSHAVPEGLGKFENQLTLLDRVCTDCEHETGKCEEQLLRCGPEAFLRRVLGIQSDINPFRRGSAGQGPLVFKTKYPGTKYEILVETISGTRNLRPLPQILLVKPNGECLQILMTNLDISVEELEKRISDTGLKGKCTIKPISSNEEEEDRIFNLLRKSKYFVEENVDEDIQPVIEKVEAVGKFIVDRLYFRAVAKIAFHYFLAYNDKFIGHEECFNSIRRFIVYDEGDRKSLVVERRGNLIQNMNQGYRPKYDGHILIYSVNDRFIKSKVQMFIGPDIDPAYYDALLGNNPHKVWHPPKHFGHFYSYYKIDERKQYAGKMIRLHQEELIRVVQGLVLPPKPKIL